MLLNRQVASSREAVSKSSDRVHFDVEVRDVAGIDLAVPNGAARSSDVDSRRACSFADKLSTRTVTSDAAEALQFSACKVSSSRPKYLDASQSGWTRWP